MNFKKITKANVDNNTKDAIEALQKSLAANTLDEKSHQRERAKMFLDAIKLTNLGNVAIAESSLDTSRSLRT
jgi:hypothetical protein